MVGEDRIIMRGSELRRVHAIRQVLAKQLTQQQAGEALGLTPRHIRRLRDRLHILMEWTHPSFLWAPKSSS